MRRPVSIAPPKGKLGVLTPGMGAVSTTFMAGVELVRQGHSVPVGSLTQMGTIRLGKRTEARVPKIKEFVKLAELNDLVFGGWDIFPDNAYQAAAKAGVLDAKDLAKAEKFLKDDQADEGGVRPELREEPERHERQEGQEQIRSRRADPRGHPRRSKRRTSSTGW